MRIGFLSHKYPQAGMVGGIFVHELARAIAAEGHEVHVLSSGTQRDVQIRDGVHLHLRLPALQMTALSVDDEYVSRPRLSMAKLATRTLMELRRFVSVHRLDVVHAHWAVPMGLLSVLAPIGSRVPVVITAHGRDLYLNALDGKSRPPAWLRPFSRFALSRADRVIFTTPDYVSWADQYRISRSRIRVIPNGVDVTLFRDLSGDLDLRASLGCREGDLLVLFVGSLDQKKGLPVLVEAVAQVSRTGLPVKLAFAGEGPLRASLEAQVRQLGITDRVTLLGQVDFHRLPAIFSACDIYVQPSLLEPFGIAVLEAGACGRPVIATDIPGLRSLIIPEETGLLVQPGDAGSLASAIARLAADPALRRRLGQAHCARIEQRLTWRAAARATLDCYESALCDARES